MSEGMTGGCIDKVRSRACSSVLTGCVRMLVQVYQ